MDLPAVFISKYFLLKKISIHPFIHLIDIYTQGTF